MKIAVIGAGEMGGAFATGLLKVTVCKPEDVCVANPHTDKLERFAAMGAAVTTDNKAAADGADVVAVVVKPGVVKTVLDELRPELDYDRQILVNMAASVTIDRLETWLDKDGRVPAIVQALPNIGIAERASMTFLSPNTPGREVLGRLLPLFDDLGRTMITDERLLAAGTAMCGCGIAYVLRFVRAATEAGVELGFKADDARRIFVQTLRGAVSLLEDNDRHPEAEIDKVTTPGGMTIKGLNTMERNGFTPAVIAGIKAALE